MTVKQKAARANFKKAVTEAQKLRKKNPKMTQAQALKAAFAANKKVGAIKIVEKGETKKTKPKATYQQIRTKAGTFKGLKKVGAVKKKAATKKLASKRITDIHKDNKSHNVNIRVLSGYKKPMYSMGNLDTKKLLSQLAKETKLKKDVITILTKKVNRYDNDYKSLLKDILYNGLQSGVISELIYYSDTTKWYNKHKVDIKILLKEAMYNFGTSNPSDLFGKKWDISDPFVEETSNKNLLSWFSFEEIAREISDRLGYDL